MRDDDLRDNPLAAELIAEHASTYFRTAKKLESSLKALRDFDQQHQAIPVPPAQHHRRREELLAEAAELSWYFIIQREALKLPYYDELFADFDIPDEVRRRMGPRKFA